MEIPQYFTLEFRARCRPLEGGCVVYEGGHTVRLPDEIVIDVRFVTPRRAAYIIANKGHLPEREIKTTCSTPGCISAGHLTEGRERRRRPVVITRKLILDILCESSQSTRCLARKFGLGRAIVTRIRELGLNYPLPELPERPPPRYRSFGF